MFLAIGDNYINADQILRLEIDEPDSCAHVYWRAEASPGGSSLKSFRLTESQMVNLRAILALIGPALPKADPTLLPYNE